MGIFEIFLVDSELRRLIRTNASEAELIRTATQSGMATLLEDAINKVESGLTTCEEILRVLGPQNAFELPCPNCSAILEERFRFCPHCGIAMQNECEGCGQLLNPAWQYCPSCRKQC